VTYSWRSRNDYWWWRWWWCWWWIVKTNLCSSLTVDVVSLEAWFSAPNAAISIRAKAKGKHVMCISATSLKSPYGFALSLRLLCRIYLDSRKFHRRKKRDASMRGTVRRLVWVTADRQFSNPLRRITGNGKRGRCSHKIDDTLRKVCVEPPQLPNAVAVDVYVPRYIPAKTSPRQP